MQFGTTLAVLHCTSDKVIDSPIILIVTESGKLFEYLEFALDIVHGRRE